MRSLKPSIGFVALLLSGACAASAAQRPPDVRADHWAAPAVARALDAGVLRLQSDGRFHGDAKVSRIEVAMAMGTLGRALVDGKWKPAGKSVPVPDSVTSVWEKTGWKSEPVRRYTLAAILVRFGDYVANALRRPAANAAVGKSVALPPVMVTLPSSSPAYAAVSYLAQNRMVRPGSPLLKPDDSPVTGGELSRALAELGAGATDRLTDLGHTADGSTPDDALQKRPGK